MKLKHSRIEIDPLDTDYTLRLYPASYLVKIMQTANKLGLEGKKVEVIEVRENYANGKTYIDLIDSNEWEVTS